MEGIPQFVVSWQALGPEPVYAHGRITTSIVFNREVSQIFQKKCFQCHTEANVSMSLTTYRDARPWAVAIKEEILERRMPPWSAVNGYGHFSNDVSLTAREVSLILSWADGGAPSGVLAVDEDKPAVIVPALSGWDHGQPDAVVAAFYDNTAGAPVSGCSTAKRNFTFCPTFGARGSRVTRIT